jgi:hypothetical protein
MMCVPWIFQESEMEDFIKEEEAEKMMEDVLIRSVI